MSPVRHSARKLLALGVLSALLAVTGCGGSGASSSSKSSTPPSIDALRSCLQGAGFQNINSANPGQLTVSVPPNGSVTITLEGSPQQAEQALARANRGAQAFGGGLGRNLVVGSTLLGGVQGVTSSDLSKVKACASKA